MALVAFLRGVNVGGHRAFRPSLLAKAMARYDVVNVGATGTFVVRRPITKTRLKAELKRRLPFAAHIMICDGKELLRLQAADPFRKAPKGADVTRFASIMDRRPRIVPRTPVTLPPRGRWLLKILKTDGRFVLGVYRRDMKVIGYLGMIDKLVGAPVTTRGWNTIQSVIEIL